MVIQYLSLFILFFFNDTATTEIYPLSLHDALPISAGGRADPLPRLLRRGRAARGRDRKSTRLNSSHDQISYAVFCLQKKKNTKEVTHYKHQTNNKQQNHT